MTPVWTTGVRRTVLSNGLRVLVQPVAGSPAAAIVTRVAAGFFDEPDEWAGISHVLEHMFFKGTATRGVGDIARATRSVGGYLNAATAYDHTSYYAVLPVRALGTALEVQADALRHTLLDPDDLSRELNVIVEEARRKLDTAPTVAQETLHAILFDRHRIRRWRIGTEEGLLRLTRDDLVAYHESRYVPERTIVAIAGGVDPDAALDLANRHYGDWVQPLVTLDAGPEEPLRDGVRVTTLRGDVQQAQLVIGWRAVPTLHPDAIPLDLAAAVLSLGRGSWLYRKVREPGIASSVGAWNYSPSEVGVFSMAAELEPDRLDDAINELSASVSALRERGPSRADLERTRVLLRARWARRFESAEGRASELAAAEGASDVELLDREYTRLMSVTADEIRDAVNRHLDPTRVAAVAFLPVGRGEDLSTARLASALERVPPPAASAPIPPAQQPHPRVPCSPRQSGEVLHVALPGVDLLAQHRAGTPTATVAVYRLRLSADPMEHAGLAALAVRSAVRGAAGDDAAALTDRFERLGGTLGTSVGREHYGFATTVLADHAATAAALLRSVLYEPHLAPEDVLLERGLLEDDARQAADDMYRRPIQLATRAAFGDSGLGLPVLGFPETVSRIAPEFVKEWHTRGLATGRTTVVAVGDFPPADLMEQLAATFGSDPRRGVIETEVSTEWVPMPEPRQIIEVREKAQTGLALLFHGPGRRDADRHAALVWAAHSGGLGGRLFQTLRDTHALAYTVTAYAWQGRHVGGLMTYIGTSPDREDEARQRLLEEIESFGEAPPSDDEVSGAIEYLVGQAEVRRQSARAMVSEIADVWLHGTGLEELVSPGSQYRSVTPDAVLAVARSYLAGQPHAEGVVRGQPSADPGRDSVTF